MAVDLACALDPVTFAQDKLGFGPDEWQSEFLREDGNCLLNCSRQSGKSTTTAVKGLYKANYTAGALVLLVSKAFRQSQELFGKVTEFRKRLSPGPVLIEDNKLSATFKSGSRIVCLPGSGDTIRGFSGPSLIIEDEAAFVDDGVYTAIRPMLAVSAGQLVLMSTPHGRRGHFYDAHRSEEFRVFTITADQCPRIAKDFLASERRALGESLYRQEYFCEFLDTVDQVFRTEHIERAISDEITPLFGPSGQNVIQPLKF
jgi:hypothetical protein